NAGMFSTSSIWGTPALAELFVVALQRSIRLPPLSTRTLARPQFDRLAPFADTHTPATTRNPCSPAPDRSAPFRMRCPPSWQFAALPAAPGRMAACALSQARWLSIAQRRESFACPFWNCRHDDRPAYTAALVAVEIGSCWHSFARAH